MGGDVSFDALRLGKKLSPETNFVMAAGEALPFSTYTKDRLLKAASQRDLKALGFQLYVLVNGLLLHLLSSQVRFPFATRCESFQTSSGMRRLLSKAGFKQIRVDQQQEFFVTAQKGLSLDAIN